MRELEIARKAWEMALLNLVKAPISVNLYHDTSVSPKWAKRAKFVKQTGKLRFYKEVR